MTSTNIRARRIIAAGAFAAAAIAAPFAAALTGSGVSEDLAGPACLAWFGNKEDGKCLSYSNGNGVNVGTPEFGLWGPDGAGISTGPLFPGRIYGNP
ncbi:DUF7155 family protein [Mycobacterium deserti]|uniref:Uncharacterized protein n=1 Tax=Mycobacterium deserti TaxID=2978347 RepID=A0ABT2MDL5_9MYCO|nr:hypothetical protein [Mycobacterium deserti]MCT7660353.1 hypothetical protein [Mycobacterium deserti]